jgi:hypothetical protein
MDVKKSLYITGNRSDDYKSLFESKQYQSYLTAPQVQKVKYESGIKIHSKRSAQALYLNASNLMGNHFETCVFMTITMPAPISVNDEAGYKEVSKRISSWVGNKGGFEYVFGGKRKWCRVVSINSKTSTIHWHFIVDLEVDVGTGVDHIAVKKQDNRTLGAYLKEGIWARMAECTESYGFGRVEILPVRNKEAVARYLARHITLESRERLSKGGGESSMKKVVYSGVWKKISPKNVYREGTGFWKKGVDRFMELLKVEKYEDLKVRMGRRWAYHNRRFIYYLGQWKEAS